LPSSASEAARRALRSPYLLSVAFAAAFLLVWQALTGGSAGGGAALDPEYAKLAGPGATGVQKSAIPSPVEVARRALELGARAFDTQSANDQGIAIHLLASLGRVFSGYALAVLAALPLGVVLGLSPRLATALNPFIQVLRPISPLAWMPLALYTLRDSGASAIFIIFICSVWPMLINTTFGVASVRQDWLNVARVFGLPTAKRVRKIVLPAAVPMILTGMRISIGIAWLVIVAAEMVVGTSGIGYFVWNEWNNLQISSMIVAVLLIGLVGLVLDQALATLTRALSFRE
jgi:nitrate/nitrite transport system permease protein